MLSETSKYRAIAEQLARSIRLGQISNGDKLSPQRKLAAHYKVTVGCITRAYALLEQQGLVTARVGDGTYVNYTPPQNATSLDTNTPINLAFTAPAVHPLAKEAFQTVLSAIAADTMANSEWLAYPPELGLHQHRAAVATWLQRLSTVGQSKRVMLTNGAQHSIACVIRTGMRPGEVLLTETLSYHGLLPLGQELRLQAVGVACDGEGLIPEALERAARAYDAKVLYCIPTLHMPTAATMSLRRRHEIAAVAKQHKLLIIEDCVHALGIECPLPALSSLLPEQSFLIGSFSKWTASALRIGFIEADPKWFGKISMALRADSLTSSTLMAEVLMRWIQSDELLRMTRKQCEINVARFDAAQQLIRTWTQRHTQAFTVQGDPQFPFLWLTLPDFVNAQTLATRLLQEGVSVRPSAHFKMGRAQCAQGLRISLGATANLTQMLHGLEMVLQAATQSCGP